MEQVELEQIIERASQILDIWRIWIGLAIGFTAFKRAFEPSQPA